MFRIICFLMLTAALPGCGNKGPLYLPNPQAQGGNTADSQQTPRK